MCTAARPQADGYVVDFGDLKKVEQVAAEANRAFCRLAGHPGHLQGNGPADASSCEERRPLLPAGLDSEIPSRNLVIGFGSRGLRFRQAGDTVRGWGSNSVAPAGLAGSQTCIFSDTFLFFLHSS